MEAHKQTNHRHSPPRSMNSQVKKEFYRLDYFLSIYFEEFEHGSTRHCVYNSSQVQERLSGVHFLILLHHHFDGRLVRPLSGITSLRNYSFAERVESVVINCFNADETSGNKRTISIHSEEMRAKNQSSSWSLKKLVE